MTSLDQTERRAQLIERLLPFILTAVIVILDQVTKMMVVAWIERYGVRRHAVEVLGTFLRFIHVRNLGIAFSIGNGLSVEIRRVVFIILPALVLVALGFYYFRSNDFTKGQRWIVAGIFGGGIGNLIDRIFRIDGVVDWIDFKFFGIFGWERFPTFNVADSTTTVCGILLVISVMLQKPTETTGGNNDQTE